MTHTSTMIMLTLVLLTSLGCGSDSSSSSDPLRTPGAGDELVAACTEGGLTSETLTQDGVMCAVVVSPVVESCGDTRIMLGDSIGADMVLDGCYETTGFKVEAGVTLTLTPGADLRFLDSDASIQVEGTIIAEGTAEAPIYLNGGVTAGSWGGIRLLENSTGNRFDYVVFENGGGFDWNTSAAESAMLVVQDDTTEVTVSNTTFRGSAGYGVHLAAAKSLTRFDAVEFEGNNAGAAQIEPNQMGVLASTLAFGEDQWVFVENGNVTDDQTWQPCVPWRFRRDITLKEDAVVSAAAGSSFTFEAEGYIEVEQAKFRATGTADQAVLFTGLEKRPGAWGGIHFLGETSTPPNVLDHVIVEFAGGFDWNTSAVENTAVALQKDTVAVEIRDSIIRNSSALGVFVGSAESSLTVQNSVFEGNESAAKIPSNLVDAFDQTSTFGESQDVLVSGGTTTRDTTASDCVPYLVVQELKVADGMKLTIEPGAELRFDSNVGLEVEGELSAMAVEDNVAVLHGDDDSAGAWGGVRLSDAAVATFDWVVLKNGGGIDWNTSASKEANLNVLKTDATLAISNTTIRGSAGGGIYLNEDPTMTCANVKIEDVPAVFGVFDDLASACD